jgi:hypothetical protein
MHAEASTPARTRESAGFAAGSDRCFDLNNGSETNRQEDGESKAGPCRT